jgi:lactoylglutathione lyase
MIKGISHHGLKVKDMDRTIDFYCSGLGFEEAFRIHNPDGTLAFVYLSIGPAHFVELFPGGKGEYRYNPTAIGPDHICLEVDDAYAAVEHLKAKGVAIDEDIITGRSGSLIFWVKDPDGNRIEFMQFLEDSRQAKAMKDFAAKHNG